MHIKTVNVTNAKNVLVQVPGFVVNKWALRDGDRLEVHISDDEQSIIITKRKTLRPGSNINAKGKGLLRTVT